MNLIVLIGEDSQIAGAFGQIRAFLGAGMLATRVRFDIWPVSTAFGWLGLRTALTDGQPTLG